MPNPPEMAPLVRSLGDADPSQREAAAQEIFRRGRELVRATAQSWLGDPDLARLLASGELHSPEITVGVAVEPEAFERIRSANGSPRLANVPPDQDAKEFELHCAGGVCLDILTTNDRGGAGAIARYLQKFGEGIQQIELVTQNVDQATEILRKRFSLEPIYPQTRAGAGGTRVNFFLVPTQGGKKILVELVEAASPTKR